MQEKIKKGYKVVCQTSGEKLMSATGFGRPCEYILDTWVFPKEKDGPLAVFESLEDALNVFAVSKYKPLQVYSCMYKPSKYRVLWKITELGTYNDCCRVPLGTSFAEAVMLKELIHL